MNEAGDRQQVLREYGAKESDVMTGLDGREYIMVENEDEDNVRFSKVYLD